ncbi:hypothetical protein CATRI_12705 [Corynebacterium atrinae]|nr:hypothetical protein CATRI_12705 [Corynebacterium atrinae]
MFGQGLFSSRLHALQILLRVSVCGALSVALTSLKLHTHPDQHNSPGQS